MEGIITPANSLRRSSRNKTEVNYKKLNSGSISSLEDAEESEDEVILCNQLTTRAVGNDNGEVLLVTSSFQQLHVSLPASPLPTLAAELDTSPLSPLPVSDDSFSDTEIPSNQEVLLSSKNSNVLASSVLVREEAVAEEKSHDSHDSPKGIPSSPAEVPTKEDFEDLCKFICGRVDNLDEKISILESENFMLRAKIIKIQAQLKNSIATPTAQITTNKVIVSDAYNSTQKTSSMFITPKKVARNTTEVLIHKIPTRNRYGGLSYTNNLWVSDDTHYQADNDSVVNHDRTPAPTTTSQISHQPKQRRPEIVVQENPEKNIILSHRQANTVPGNSLYSKIVNDGKQIGIFGDSMIKRLMGHKISKDIHCGTAKVRPFIGATANESSYHMESELKKCDYDIAVICSGINNIPPNKTRNSNIQTEQTPHEIAEEIINAGYKCKSYGVNDVVISLLTVRKGFEEKVHKVNNLLIEYCRAAHFYFVDHSNILLKHLYDGLHIDSSYLYLYANNISNLINTI